VLIAAERPIAAALVWYGAASEREWEVSKRFTKPFDDIVKRINCPVLGIFGEGDHVISLDDVRRFRDLLDRHDKSYTIKIYRDVPHGWLNDTMPGRYRKPQSDAAWAAQQHFLKQAFAGEWPSTRVRWRFESGFGRDYDFSKNRRQE
jgi:carboxymethylenebutenolidase